MAELLPRLPREASLDGSLAAAYRHSRVVDTVMVGVNRTDPRRGTGVANRGRDRAA
jgi:hypothetical protein